MIRDQREFEELVARLREAEHFGIDTEFVRETTFRPRLCLIQLWLSEGAVAVDPFEVEDLAPLLEVIESPDVEKVVHAGQQDMELFFLASGRPPRRVFDTQVAAALLGHGESIGYSRLVEKLLGQRLDKRETFTDWSRRPLREAQVEYALNDVRYLLPLREKLLDELARRGRESWLSRELEVFERSSYYQRDPETMYQRVRGAGKLEGKALAALQELAAWREEEARRLDRPRGHIVSDGILVEVARRLPTSLEDLRAVRGLHPRLLRRSGAGIVARVSRALKRSPTDYPAPVERRPRDPKVDLLVDLLEVLIKVHAARLSISAGYLATRKELAELASDSLAGRLESSAHRVLRGWRGELVGEELLAFLRGKTRIRVEALTGNVVLEDLAAGESP